MAYLKFGPRQNPGPGCGKIVGRNLRQKLKLLLLDFHKSPQKVATAPRHCLQVLRRKFHLFVFDDPPGKLGLRVLHLFARVNVRHRQQQLAFDVHEVGGHHEVVGGQFQVTLADEFNVGHVLLGQKRHGNVHHVKLLLADQVKQEVKRPFKAFQKHFERVGRDVKPLGHGKKRLTVQTRQRPVHPFAGRAEHLINCVGRECFHG